jgi:hypothetical protein
MTWWRWAGMALCLVVLAVMAATHPDGRRAGLRSVISGVARCALAAGTVLAAQATVGDIAGLVVAYPMVLAAGWFGRSTLGVFNFLVLQWFGVRLGRALPGNLIPGPYRIADVDSMDAAAAHGFATGDVVHIRPTGRWSLLRWVWPLTGWWSRYRYIHRPTP